MNCPLCDETQFSRLRHLHLAETQIFHCLNCDLIYKDPKSFLSLVAEKARYDLHTNSEGEQGYLNFLSPVTGYIEGQYPLPLRENLKFLDYGSGPQPVLANVLRGKGFQVDIYDLFFAPDLGVFQNQYDVIISTEVVEHFHHPSTEFARMREALKPAGELVLMTQLHLGPERFENWWYPRDPTHVVFYSLKTMDWIRERWKFQKLTVNPGLKSR